VKHGRPLQLLIGARLPFGDSKELPRRAEQLLAELGALETQRLPLHWSFGVRGLLESQSRAITNVITEIKTRRKSRGDRLLPAGFQGAVHPLLLPEELTRELQWCSRNPWFPAMKEVFGEQPQMILPLHADMLREAAARCYSSQGFGVLVVPVPLWRLDPQAAGADTASGDAMSTRRRPPWPGWGPLGGLVLLPALSVPPSTPPSMLARLLARLMTPLLLLLIELDGPDAQAATLQRGWLAAVLHALGEGHALSFPSLQPELLQGPSSPDAGRPSGADPLLQDACLQLPRWRWALDRAEALRGQRRKTAADYRAILQTLAGAPAPHDEEGRHTAARQGPKVVSASMSGLVSLPGESFEATFSGGCLSGLRYRGRQLLCGRPGRSYVVVGNSRCTLQTESAFSFEREGERGLVAVLVGQPPGASGSMRVEVEAYFRERQPELALSVTARYPEWEEGLWLQQLVPFELPLYELEHQETLPLEVAFGDGTHLREALPAREQTLLLHGNRFTFARGAPGLYLEFPGERGPAPLQLRTGRARRRYLLSVNPMGSYLPQPARGYSGLEDHVYLRIGLEEG
jgi:hypothetical protein